MASSEKPGTGFRSLPQNIRPQGVGKRGSENAENARERRERAGTVEWQRQINYRLRIDSSVFFVRQLPFSAFSRVFGALGVFTDTP